MKTAGEKEKFFFNCSVSCTEFACMEKIFPSVTKSCNANLADSNLPQRQKKIFRV